MIFKTMTSEYEITKEINNVYKLKKTAQYDFSSVSAGRVFIARKEQIELHKQDGLNQLFFGAMNTSHIEQYAELEQWLKDN